MSSRRAGGGRWWFVTRKYPPAVGGMERLSFELTTRMATRRLATIVAMRGGTTRLPLFFCVAAWRLLVACLKGDCALVHLGDGALAPLAAIPKAFGVPVAMTLHGLDVVWDTLAYRALRLLFQRRLDAYVCISAATREVAARHGLPHERLHVIGVGVDAPAGSPTLPRERECLLFVGRLIRRKGLVWFVKEVLPFLAAARPALQLVVVGDGPERDAVEAIARRSGVDERVLWQGVLNTAERDAWYARATLCVMPNIRLPGDMEGFGIVAIEAAAAGCLVLAAAVEGLEDALAGGGAGVLLPSGDAEAWIRAISAQLDNPDARTHAAAAAREFVLAHCRWRDVVDSYERVLGAAAAYRGRTPKGSRRGVDR